MLRYPSAQSEVGEFEDHWRLEADELALRLRTATSPSPSDIYEVDRIGVSREPCYDWFKFIADRDRRWKLMMVLNDTIYEELAAPHEVHSTSAELDRLREVAQAWAEQAIVALGPSANMTAPLKN